MITPAMRMPHCATTALIPKAIAPAPSPRGSDFKRLTIPKPAASIPNPITVGIKKRDGFGSSKVIGTGKGFRSRASRGMP